MQVFSVSSFAELHPGGAKVLEAFGGRDATDDFYELHRADVLGRYRERLLVGKLQGSQPLAKGAAEPALHESFNCFCWSLFPTHTHTRTRARARTHTHIDTHVIHCASTLLCTHYAGQMDQCLRCRSLRSRVFSGSTARTSPSRTDDFNPQCARLSIESSCPSQRALISRGHTR
jgi:hypothetical protein